MDRLAIEYHAAAELAPYARNARTHSAAQVGQIVASIREFGWTNPVLIDQAGGIIAGHGRVLAAQQMGMAQVPCIRLGHLTDAQRRAYVLADNQLALNAGWDEDLLALELAALNGMDFDLGLTGFDSAEIDRLLASIDPDVDSDAQADRADAVPDIRPDAITEPGDLWLLGDHRLLCGDSTEPADVARLMGGAKADAVVTDPPYGISVVKRGMVGADFGVAKKGRYAPVIGDKVTPSVRYLLDLAPRVIIWGGNYFADQLPPSGSWLIWDKRRDTGIENTFADCELAWSNIGSPARVHRQLWNGMIREGEHGKREHPTQKPVSLMTWCIGKTEGQILDPFLGSGTTLIAAAQTARRCYAMELSPQYVDVAVRRWQTYTGNQATLEGDGRTFAQVEAERTTVLA